MENGEVKAPVCSRQVKGGPGKEGPPTQKAPKPRRPRYGDKHKKKKKPVNLAEEGGCEAGETAGPDCNGATELDGGDGPHQKPGANAVSQGLGEGPGLAGKFQQSTGEAEAPQGAAGAPEEEGESWDTLFNDDGDCLDPHLIEEVNAWAPLAPNTHHSSCHREAGSMQKEPTFGGGVPLNKHKPSSC